MSNWRDNGWLVDHQASAEETRDLFAVARRDLRDSGVAGLSSDTQLGLAYNAALQVSTAALAAAGYRAARDRKHHWTIQSLAHTIGADAKLIGRLDAFRKNAMSGTTNGPAQRQTRKRQKCASWPRVWRTAYGPG